MATSTETVAAKAATPKMSLDGDRWVQFPATWETYQSLCESRGDKSRPRYFYFDGRLTVVSPGQPHEWIKTRMGWLIEEMFLALEIDFHATGSVTLLKSKQRRAGTEADESYYVSNIAHVLGKKNLVMGEDPAPDLTVEVVVSHDEDDAIESYRLFGVREVWVVKDGELSFLSLGFDGHYAASLTSLLFPNLTSDELAPWVFRQDLTGERRVRIDFRAWVLETLVPRKRLADDNP